MNLVKQITRAVCIILIVILAFFLVFNVALYIKRAVTGDVCPTFLGLTTAVVISGSMEPDISINDYVVAAATGKYAVGDTVMYRGESKSVTHKIESIYEDGEGNTWVVAKGTNNNKADEPIPYESIVGRVILVIPGVGAIQEFFATPAGFLVITLAVALLLFLPELSRKKNQRGKST